MLSFTRNRKNEPECKNTECFANLRGRCYALTEANNDCSFFKPRYAVDTETMRRLLPRQDKPAVEYNKTEKMNKAEFIEWFTHEWDEVTLPLLINHRDKIAKMNITMEL